MKYAAAILVLMFVSKTIWTTIGKSTQEDKRSGVQINKGIEIGSDKAILTIEDGSQVVLEKGNTYKTQKATSNGEEIVYSNSNSSSLRELVFNYLTVPRGGQFYVKLSDGTGVWLNSETRLKYPVSFTEGETREVELVYGEAYFEVSPSTEHQGSHFFVITKGQQVEVLGTEFNIKAYKDENQISTTLVEGKVTLKNGIQTKQLKPGYQLRLNKETQQMDISKVDVSDEISWKNGLFSFKDKSLYEITKVLSRWYDVNVEFENKELRQITFNGVFRKAQKIENILNILKNTNEIDYSINQNTIIMK
jgi:ferric-dicitrate binding protein FerR (iron transport regulator)